jgi:AcrR family transcriptional regulator
MALYPEPVPRDRKILEAAAKLFYERGFSGVSVDEIGERAGVTGPAIYRHFKGKEEILTSLFDEALDGLLDATVPGGEVGRERLEALVAAHAGYVQRESELTAIWANESSALPSVSRRRFLRRTRTYFDRWADAVRECYPDRTDDDVEASVHCAIALVNSLMQWPQHLRHIEGAEHLVVAMALAAIEAGRLEPQAAERSAPAA